MFLPSAAGSKAATGPRSKVNSPKPSFMVYYLKRACLLWGFFLGAGLSWRVHVSPANSLHRRNWD